MKLKLRYESTKGTKLELDMDNNNNSTSVLETTYLSLQIIYIFTKLVQALVN
ncbi:hypothetical protein [Bacillus pseudomycoides]|uniref:hypothetical protein n=1 Tax=Bacillus pseudomycoides TaxID=64104 RepID=UPI00159B9437|nr:hypothetical protein [Bacillus pseudomycoides]